MIRHGDHGYLREPCDSESFKVTRLVTGEQLTTQSLIDTLTQQLAESQALVACIREKVGDLLDGPYVPSDRAILKALYPDKQLVETYLDRSET
jgi:hypothetical protein